MNRVCTIAWAAAATVVFIMWSARSSAVRAQEKALGDAAELTTNDLLRAAPFDRVTLIDGTVLLVDPVSPRPLPAFDPVKQREKKRRESASEIPEEGNIIVGKETKLVMPKSAKDKEPGAIEEDELKLHLLQGAVNEVTDFKVKRASIKRLEYFEDLLLLECDRLVPLHDYARAFECCLRVQLRNPGWKGLDERVNRVLFAEGSRALIDGDGERGLRLLRELLARKRDYPGLLDQIGEAYGKRVERAIRLKLYARGRRVLHELAELAPEHSLVKQMRALFVARATARVKDSESLAAPERLDALAEALRIWPTLPGIEPIYTKAFESEPTLEVGVTDVPTPLGPWVRSPADARVSRLLYLPLLASDDEEARQGKRPDQLATAVQSSDLGRRLVIRTRPGFLWSDGSRSVSAIDVGRDLIDRTDPHSPRFDARWEDMLDRVEVGDESRLEVRLNHNPLKAGAWLLGPVGPAHAGVDGRVAASIQDRPLVTNGPFGCVAATADSIELRLRADVKPALAAASAEKPAAPEAGDHSAGGGPAGKPDAGLGAAKRARDGPTRNGAKIKRIREFRLPPGQSLIAAMRRGELSLIDHVPPDQVAALEGASDIAVGRFAKPVVHVIAIDGRNLALRNRSVRRALSFAVDRKGLLEDFVLKHAVTDTDAVADGPFPKRSYADAPGVKPLEPNRWLAKMLVAAARRELKNVPIKLNLEYPAIPEVQSVIEKIADAIGQTGIDIVTKEVLPSQLEGELRAGRRFDLAYRVLRCDEPILDAGALLCPGYDAPPDAGALASAASSEILRLLLELERAADWPTARGLAIQIDRESRDELPVIPLWQLSDHYAWRDRLSGPRKEAGGLYEGVESWEIAPWVAKDPWDAH
jgi:peptide/nickel transport system substrate-binding protein